LAVGLNSNSAISTYSKSDWEKKSKSLFFPKIVNTVATRHGNAYEEEALEEYRKFTEEDIRTLALIICKKYPWMGYSPDGVVVDADGIPTKLIEIKCPLKGKKYKKYLQL
jgi:hypothetical protein